MSENVREIQAAQYEAEVLAAPEPVVLDFFSTEEVSRNRVDGLGAREHGMRRCGHRSADG
jgi:hypothetical protein